MTDYAAIMSRRHAGREWILDGDNYDGLTMLDAGNKPTQKSLDDAWADVQAEISAEANAKAATRNSALAKLKALGLTDAEVAALIGG